MISLILGAFTLGLGMKGFSTEGLPLTARRKIAGHKARIIGGACIALAMLFLIDGLWWLARTVGVVKRALE